MKPLSFEDIFAVMAAASVGDEAARVRLPDPSATDDLTTRFAIALNVLLDDLAFRAEARRRSLEEERRVTKALRESELRKAAFVESALDAIVSMDHSGMVIEWNPAAVRMFGFTRAEAVGAALSELIVPPGLRAAHVSGLAQHLATGESRILGRLIELVAVRKDGTELPVELAITRVESPGPPSFTGYIRDISERKQAMKALQVSEEQLRQSQKMEAVGRLAGGIAHDFNNLLSVIQGYTDVLLGDLEPKDARRVDVFEIQRAGRRAAELTRQLLMFSRRQVLEPIVLDLNVLLANMDKMLQRVIGADIDLVSVPTMPLGKVRADPGSIEQVIMNLVVNARDAMPRGGKLTMETGNMVLDEAYAEAHLGVVPGPHVMLAVTDTGVGMDKATQARVFEPFFTTKPVGEGTGIGLSTVFGIVQQSAGSIWLYSEPGKGTTFKIYLPLVHEVATSVRMEPLPERPRGAETILLVEDDEQVRSLARVLLQKSGYEVLVAASGDEALALAEEYVGDIDLLLTDVVMPRMSGPDLATELLTARPKTKVLCMSGYTPDSVIRHGVLTSRIPFLQKPITPESLTAKVREVLDAK